MSSSETGEVAAPSTSTSTYTPFTITSFPHNPLTTAFTAPNGKCSGIYQPTWMPGVAIIDDELSCMPSGFSKESTAFFSPGIACPSGYWSACHDTTGAASITTVTCCPTRGDISLSCVDPATLANVWSTLFCSWIAPESGKAVTLTKSDNGRTSTVVQTMTPMGGINAYGVRMVYQSTDMAAPPARSTSDTTVSASASSVASTPSSGLTTGATVAIGVVIPVVVLAMIGAWFVWWRRRKQQLQSVPAVPPYNPQNKQFENVYYAGVPVEPVPYKSELQEMPTTHAVAELPASNVRVVS